MSGLVKPRVLFLAERYPPAFGGGGRALQQVRKHLTSQGIPSLVVCGYRGIPGGKAEGVLRLPSPWAKTFPRLAAYTFALLVPPTLWLLRHKFDLVHTIGNSWSVHTTILTARFLGKSVLVSSVQNRCDDPLGIRRQRWGGMRDKIFSQATGYICCSGFQVDSYRKAGYPDDKVTFIPNFYDPRRCRPAKNDEEKMELREKLGLPRDGFLVVSIGAIVARKGIDLLAEGWIRFRKSGSTGTLVLVGPHRKRDDPSGDVDEDFVANVQSRLAEAGVADSVTLTGLVSNPQDYLKAADLFVLMSRGEGFPLALLEAMACQLPFLIWDLPDYSGYGLKTGVHGHLIPPFETDALAERLGEMAREEDKRVVLGTEARNLASSFTLDRFASDHLDLYREIVTRGANRPLAAPATKD